MPIHPANERGEHPPEDVEIRAYLTVLSPVIKPAELMRRIGLEPDESWHKGDPGPGRSRRPYHGWVLSSGRGEREPAQVHLQGLLDRLAPVADRLRALAAEPELYLVRLQLVYHTDNVNPGVSLTDSVLRQLVKIKTGLDIDIYVYGDPGAVWQEIARRGQAGRSRQLQKTSKH